MEDADEPVGEGSEGLVVGGSMGLLPVVERAGAMGMESCWGPAVSK